MCNSGKNIKGYRTIFYFFEIKSFLNPIPVGECQIDTLCRCAYVCGRFFSAFADGRPECTFVTAASFLNITTKTGIANLIEISYYEILANEHHHIFPWICESELHNIVLFPLIYEKNMLMLMSKDFINENLTEIC